MKRLLTFAFAFAFCLQQVNATTSLKPQITTEKPAFIPLVIALIAEGIAALTVTDAVILTAGSTTIAWYATTPPPSFTMYRSPDEVPDLKPDPNKEPRSGGEPVNWLIALMLAEKNLNYLQVSGIMDRRTAQEKLADLYSTNSEFRAIVDKMQTEYDSGDPLYIPVYKHAGTPIFDHFITAFKPKGDIPAIMQPIDEKLTGDQIEEIRKFVYKDSLTRVKQEIFGRLIKMGTRDTLIPDWLVKKIDWSVFTQEIEDRNQMYTLEQLSKMSNTELFNLLKNTTSRELKK